MSATSTSNRGQCSTKKNIADAGPPKVFRGARWHLFFLLRKGGETDAVLLLLASVLHLSSPFPFVVVPFPFFFVCSYSHASYLDHGGVHFAQFSCPLSARWRHVARSPFALRPGLSHQDITRTKETTKEIPKEKTRKAHLSPPPPLLLF